MKSQHKLILSSIGAVLVFLLDRFLKIFFQNHAGVKVIDGWLEFSFTKNTGIAFGIPLAQTIAYVIIGLVILAVVYLLIVLLRKKRFFEAGVMFWLLVGAFSNLLDRFRYQAVIDYLHVWRWSVFNLADVMIVVSVLVYFVYMYKQRDKKVDKPA